MRAYLGVAFLGAMAATVIAKLDAAVPPASEIAAAQTAAAEAPASIQPVAPPEPAPPPAEVNYVVTLAGDTGLNGSYQPVYASFGTKGGERWKWEDATAGIAREIDGDVNFANLETVVTDRNDIEPNLKLFAFRTHPDGV